MTWMVLIALGMIPWVIAVDRVVRGQNPKSRARSAARREFDDALRRMLAGGSDGRDPTEPKRVSAAQPEIVIGSRRDESAAPTSQTSAEKAAQEKRMSEVIRHIQSQGPSLPAGLSIIEGFVPGNDLLELTLDEDEVAAAEAAGVRLDVRVERASAGQGSLVVVGGTPLAFIRGNAQVTPRDVILRVEKVA